MLARRAIEEHGGNPGSDLIARRVTDSEDCAMIAWTARRAICKPLAITVA